MDVVIKRDRWVVYLQLGEWAEDDVLDLVLEPVPDDVLAPLH